MAITYYADVLNVLINNNENFTPSVLRVIWHPIETCKSALKQFKNPKHGHILHVHQLPFPHSIKRALNNITFWVRIVCNLLIINFSISYDKKSLQWDGN